jgi:hypothetical protein
MTWIAVGATVGSALIGAVGSNMAAGKQASAQQQATATQKQMFDTITANSQPFMNAGYGAADTLSQLTGGSGTPGTTVGNTGLPQGYLTQTFNPTQDQLNNYPGYQFALQTGAQATRNADTPGMGALSGAALKDLTNFNVGAASQNYQNYFNQDQTQKNNIFNRLSAIAGLGQSAAAGVGNSGTQLGTGIAQSQAATGASQAAGTVAGTNALSGAANTLGGLAYLNQNTGNPYSAQGLSGNNQTGYTYTDPSSVGPPAPGE